MFASNHLPAGSHSSSQQNSEAHHHHLIISGADFEPVAIKVIVRMARSRQRIDRRIASGTQKQRNAW